MILLDKLHILLRSCYKGTEHAVYFPHGTISFKTGENVVRMSPGKAAMFSLCLYLVADGSMLGSTIIPYVLKWICKRNKSQTLTSEY